MYNAKEEKHMYNAEGEEFSPAMYRVLIADYPDGAWEYGEHFIDSKFNVFSVPEPGYEEDERIWYERINPHITLINSKWYQSKNLAKNILQADKDALVIMLVNGELISKDETVLEGIGLADHVGRLSTPSGIDWVVRYVADSLMEKYGYVYEAPLAPELPAQGWVKAQQLEAMANV